MQRETLVFGVSFCGCMGTHPVLIAAKTFYAGSGVANRLKMLVVDISDKKKCKTKNRAHRLAAVQQ